MMLREWHITHAYTSYYVEPIADLDVAAEGLVRAGVASCVYVADGLAYWMSRDNLEKQRPDLKWREHESHAELKLPDGIEGWAKHGLLNALLHRFSEKKLMSPLPGPQHEYLRATMEPSSLVFGDEEVIVCPTLKLYKTGVFTISYEVIAQPDVDMRQFVSRYVNLFMRWCDEAWVPHAIAKLGAATSLHREAKDRAAREVNLGEFLLMQKAVEQSAQSIGVDGLQFKMYPAHVPIDDSLTMVLVELANDLKLGRKLLPEVSDFVSNMSAATSRNSSPLAMRHEAEQTSSEIAEQGETPSEPVVTTIEALPNAESLTTPKELIADVADVHAALDANTSHDGSEEGQTPTLSYQLSDMFDNAEFAIRVALDPPPDAKRYLRRGLDPKLTRGNYWQSRPQVSIIAFDEQPTTASEIRERFGDQLGLVMMRVASAPQAVAREQLGESLRPFEDWTLHIGQALSLCVYARERRYQVHPPNLETMDRACLLEMIDYFSMRCHQLDERASLASSVAEARAVRADLRAVENLARTGFRMGELNGAAKVAWQQLDLPATVKETREKAALGAEAANERSSEQGARFNAALTVVFGVVGAAGLTDSFTKPAWTKLGLPLPNGLEGPVCFGVSAALVGLVLWLVIRISKRS